MVAVVNVHTRSVLATVGANSNRICLKKCPQDLPWKLVVLALLHSVSLIANGSVWHYENGVHRLYAFVTLVVHGK